MAVMMVVFGVGLTAASDRASPPSFVVHRQLDAEVGKVDPGADLLLLKTKAGRLKLDAPATVTAGLHKGDRVLVDINVIRHPHPDQVARPQHPGQPVLVQQLPAEIVGIQRSVDVVTVRTRAGVLNVDLPSAAIAGLRTGDQLALELAVHLTPETSALSGTDQQRGDRGLKALFFAIFGRDK
jgi:hypothetical protein